ncbi:MAG TPA: hemerythrin domain-containing protein [Stellaceae bacterium]|nr:hemerythrin domain-containing protein [Stellaceae bacterium]
MTDFRDARRCFVLAAGATLALAGTARFAVAADAKKHEEKEVGAVEDLMREHGVLRRALLVYRECAGRLRRDPASVDPKAIHRTAMLFRTFGEDYHEKMLEEAHIFPAVRKAGGPAAAYVDVLVAQHGRGREITDYILAAAAKASIGGGDAEPLARAFETLDLMYENHAAREDTIVFPAWKDALSERQLHAMGERFEDIEHKQFGKDGFDDAVEQIGRIERDLGFADIAQFTAPPPPKA